MQVRKVRPEYSNHALKAYGNSLFGWFLGSFREGCSERTTPHFQCILGKEAPDVDQADIGVEESCCWKRRMQYDITYQIMGLRII